jgi:hypothetical protein
MIGLPCGSWPRGSSAVAIEPKGIPCGLIQEPIELGDGLVVDRGADVAVRVEGGHHRAVTKHLLHHLGVGTLD